VLAGEAAAEVTGGRRVGDASGSKGVEKSLIIATQFNVLQTSAIAEGVVGEVEDVVGFMVRQMDLQEVEFAINGRDKAELSSQGMESANAAVANAPDAGRSLVMDVAGGEARLAAAAEVGFVEAALDSPLAVV
jgi:hypothetical protein